MKEPRLTSTLIRLLGLTWLLGGFACHAVAQAETPIVVQGDTEVVELQEAQAPRPLIGSGRAVGSRTVISREVFAERSQTLADVLQSVPGVTLVQTGDGNSATRVRIRGSRFDQVLVLVDGVPLNAETADPAAARNESRTGVDLSSINLNQVESIEVIRGPATARYGPRAVAGVILLRTRQPQHKRLFFQATVGAAEFKRYQFEWTQPDGDNALTLHLAHQSGSGEYLFYDPDFDANYAGDISALEECAPEQEDGYRLRKCNRSAQTTVAVDLHLGSQHKIGVEGFVKEREGLGGVQNPRKHGQEFTVRQTLKYSGQWLLDSGTAWKANAYWKTRHTRRTDNSTVSSGVLDNQTTEDTAELDLAREAWLDRILWHTSIQASHQYLEDRYLTRHRDRLSPLTQLTAYHDQTTWSATLRHDSYSDIDPFTTGNLAATHYLNEHWGLKGGAGTGYRPPSLFELYDPENPTGPSPANPDLKPETSSSLDLGVFYEVVEETYAEIIWFEQWVKEQIVTTADAESPGNFRFENISAVQTSGVELGLSHRWRPHWSVDANATWMQPLIRENDQADERYNDNQVPGVPKLQWSTQLNWKRNDWSAYASTRYSDLRYIDTANSRFLKAYQLWDAGVAFPLWGRWSGSVDGKNLSNETYSELENFPPPGRQAHLSLRYEWE